MGAGPDEEGGRIDGKIVGSRMESDGSSVGGSAADDYADYESFQGNDRMDETYGYDLFAPYGGKGGRSL